MRSRRTSDSANRRQTSTTSANAGLTGSQATARHEDKRTKAKPFRLSAGDEALLHAVYAYHFLTVSQATRLLYSRGSLVYVRSKLRALSQQGYLEWLRLPTTGQGNAPLIYTLARKGIRHLQAMGYTDFARFRPSEQREHSYFFLQHTLRVNDCLIAAALLEEVSPHIRLAEMRHERALKRAPVYVEVSAGEGKKERIGVIPDGWLDFHIRGQERMSVVWELDRGTVTEERDFKRKLRGLLAFADGPYQKVYGSEAISIAFATTAGVHRLQRMRVWCEQALTAENAKGHADLFLFTLLPEGELDPKRLFLSAIWEQPFSSSPVALLSE